MTTAVEQLLKTFETLSADEKQDAAREVLRRMAASSPESISDESLVAAAEDLFIELDAREAADARP